MRRHWFARVHLPCSNSPLPSGFPWPGSHEKLERHNAEIQVLGCDRRLNTLAKLTW